MRSGIECKGRGSSARYSIVQCTACKDTRTMMSQNAKSQTEVVETNLTPPPTDRRASPSTVHSVDDGDGSGSVAPTR
jgi:hypothetical protein